MQRKTYINNYFLILSLLILCALSVFIGVKKLSIGHFFQTDSVEWKIIMTTRLPRTISLLLAGASLALSGLLMQQLTQNKFTSPSTVGTMQSARLGLILSLVIFPQASIINRATFAFVFAIVGTLIFVGLLYNIRAKNTIIVPIIGIMFGNVISSLGSFFAIRWDIVQEVTARFQGSFSLIHSENYQLIFLALISMIGIMIGVHYFSVIGLGKDLVTQLGIGYEKIVLIGIVLISLSTACIVLTVGNIPFVGIVIPNIVSLLKGDYFKNNLLYVTIFGANFLLICDILARVVVYPYEIPVSVIVGIIGSVLFIYLLLKGELS